MSHQHAEVRLWSGLRLVVAFQVHRILARFRQRLEGQGTGQYRKRSQVTGVISLQVTVLEEPETKWVSRGYGLC